MRATFAFCLSSIFPLTALALGSSCDPPPDVDHGTWDCTDRRCLLKCDYGYITADRLAFVCGEAAAENAKCVETMAFIVGGEKVAGSLANAEIISSVSEQSNRDISDYPHDVVAGVAFWHEGHVYVCGGHDYKAFRDSSPCARIPPSVESEKDCWRYDACANEWVSAPDLNYARSYAGVAFDYDGRPFVMGGAFNGTALDTTEIMRMSLVGKQTWTNGTELNEPKFGHCVLTTAGSKLMLTAGGHGYKRTEVIDLHSDNHEVISNLHHKRYAHACTRFFDEEGRDVWLLAGGLAGGGDKLNGLSIDSVEVWNNEHEVWEEGEILPETRAGATMLVIDGQPHLIGGSSFKMVEDILIYNTTARSWEVSTKRLKTNRAYHAATEVPVTMFDNCP